MADQVRVDVVTHLPAMRRYARALTRDDHAADDLVQEALVRACERAGTYDAARPLKTWLLAILHNQFVSGQRRRRAEARRDTALAAMRIDAVSAGQEFAAYLQQIAARFDALPEGQRAVLHLIAVEGLGYRETADALGIAVGTVMSRLSRARAALRASDPDERHLHLIGGSDAR